VYSEMRLYECRFILEVLISGLRIPREFRFFLDLHRNSYLCSAQICKSVCSDSGFLFCLMSLFFVDFCFVCDELLIQIQEFIVHHHVDDEEIKSVEMKNRVFRAHLCFCQ
jgi:hypothetical protein